MLPKSTTFLTLLAGLAAAKDIPRMPEATLGSPTVPSASFITPAPYVDDNLFKRVIATCGFISGDSASPITCAAGYNCVATAKANLAFACCNNVECENNWAVCRPFGQTNCMGYNLDDTVCSSIYGSILQCSQDAPYCYQYALSSARGATDTYYSLACGTTSEDILVLATATNGAKQTEASKPNTGNDVSEAVPGFPSISSFSSPTSTAAKPSTPSSPASPSPSSSGGSILSTRSIIIISVIGAGVLFVALIVGWCLWKAISRRNRDNIDPAKMSQADYQSTVTGSIQSWRTKTPLGANPNVQPSVHGSVYGGRGGNGAPRPMQTVPEY